MEWFNNNKLSDIEIFCDLDSNNEAKSWHCHQIVIYLLSPVLLQTIKNQPIEENNNSSFIIIEELQGKHNETELFLKSLYDLSKDETYARFNHLYTVISIHVRSV